MFPLALIHRRVLFFFLCYQEIAVCSDHCTVVRYSSQFIDYFPRLQLVIEDAETFPHANLNEYAEISPRALSRRVRKNH